MSNVTKIINKIKGGHNALTSHQFKILLQEFDSDFSDLTLYTEVRWMNRGQCLNRFFILRCEIKVFIETIQKLENLK